MSNNDKKHGGRVGRLDEQTLGYYRRVEQALSEGFNKQEDDQVLFLNNVFTTLSEEALSVSQNQTASRIVEHLLQEASLAQLTQFAAAVSKDWELACTDRFASHVTQTLVSQLGGHYAAGQQSEEAFDLIVELYSYLMSNLAFHMQNTYTSHIVRVMLETLGGVRVSENVVRSRVARHGKGGAAKGQVKVTKQNQCFTGLLQEMCDKVTTLGKIKDHIKNNLSNPVLQTMLLVLHARDEEKCQSVCQALINQSEIFHCPDNSSENDEKASLPELVEHEIGSHFIEQVLYVAGEDLMDGILQTHLLDATLAMAVHPAANYVLQKLIRHCHTAEQFEKIFKKLSHHLESVLCMNHHQVIVCLAEGCVKHGTKQDRLTKALLKAFHCFTPEERQIKCVPLFASLTAYETFYKIPSDNEHDSDSDSDQEISYPELRKVNLHGSLLLQQIMQFGNPKLAVTSLLQMKATELRLMSCDQCGSHVIEAFLKSPTIGEKSRDVLYVKLKGMYCDLACNKSGSRTMDTLFNTASVRHKFTIADELVKHESKVRGSQFGRILWHHYYLEQYQRDSNQWKQRQTSEVKKRKLFQDMFADDSKKAKKKKPAGIEDEETAADHLRLDLSDDQGPTIAKQVNRDSSGEQSKKLSKRRKKKKQAMKGGGHGGDAVHDDEKKEVKSFSEQPIGQNETKPKKHKRTKATVEESTPAKVTKKLQSDTEPRNNKLKKKRKQKYSE